MSRTILAALLAAILAGALAAPAHAGAWKKCGVVRGDHVSANRATSCALAKRVARRHDADDFADGRRVRVKSPVTGRTYRFYLWYQDASRWVVRARGDAGPLKVQVRE